MHEPSVEAPDIRCAFCTKTPDEVQHMVAGPGVYICDACVEAAAKIIADHRASQGST
jgi:ATP-dependent Clp protease ATP-binding subunit ClpX